MATCPFLYGGGAVFSVADYFLSELTRSYILLYASPLFLFMAKKFSKPFYKSKAWQNARQAALERDHYLCQDCLKDGAVTAAREVHHIIELTPDNIDDPEVNTNIDNLVSLCRTCHERRHLKEKRFRIDKNGNLLF